MTAEFNLSHWLRVLAARHAGLQAGTSAAEPLPAPGKRFVQRSTGHAFDLVRVGPPVPGADYLVGVLRGTLGGALQVVGCVVELGAGSPAQARLEHEAFLKDFEPLPS